MYILFILTLLLSSKIYGKDIIVNKGESIKNAVEAAMPRDRIIVKEGLYKEYEILITKPIELIGEGYPVIDGISKGEIIIIRADSVTIKGFYVNNSGFSGTRDFAAIRIENSSYCSIVSNKLINNYFGIYLANSKNCSILYNEAMSNAVSESSSGNGIHLWKCRDNIIKNNTITGHRDGIYFEFVDNSRIENNSSFKNIRYGLHFMFSNNNEYENNVFTENGAGVAVMYTKKTKMINNRFINNKGSNAYGLLLKDITDSFIYNNHFIENTVGIYAEGAARVLISNNNFISNGYACRILGNCEDDTLRSNNFIGNTFDITTNSQYSTNIYDGNYWDKYKGYDLDNNGMGDIPYKPVSMFSKIIERTPESVFLLRSFITDLLDISEKIFPVFTPAKLEDTKPLMQKINFQ